MRLIALNRTQVVTHIYHVVLLWKAFRSRLNAKCIKNATKIHVHMHVSCTYRRRFRGYIFLDGIPLSSPEF